MFKDSRPFRIMENTKKKHLNIWKHLLLHISLFFFYLTPSYAIDVSFQWDPNSEPDIGGYRVFCREEGQSYNYTNPSWEGTDTLCTIYDLDENKTYYFVSRSFDTQRLESSDSKELYLEAATTPNNQPPIAVIAEDYIEANPGTTITLDGSNSTDTDDGIASYLWTQVDGTPVTLSDHSSELVTFTAPKTDQYGSNLTFKLTITDFGGFQSTATCFVYVINDFLADNTTISSAIYIQKLRRVSVEAVSDAPVGSLTLTAWANYGTGTIKLGELKYSVPKSIYINTFKKINVPPDSIIVISSGGGSDTVQCIIK
jgi:hypothetical protein